MKSLKRKLPYAIFTVIFTVFFLANDMICNYLLRLSLINSYNNTPYSDYSVTFVMESQKGENIDLSEVLYNGLLEDCVLLKYNMKLSMYHEVVYCDTTAVKINGNLIFGNDFISGGKTAAAGIDAGYILGESVYIDGYTYVIKAILDRHISDGINYAVFFSDNDLCHVESRNSYVLTSANYKRVKGAYQALKDYLTGENIRMKEIEVRNAKFADYIGYHKMAYILVSLLLIFYAVLVFLARLIWLRIKWQEMFVLTLLGETRIGRNMALRYIGMWTIAFAISFGVFYVTVRNPYYGYSPIIRISAIILGTAVLTSIKMYFHRYLCRQRQRRNGN
jgi:hypothetical protein